MHVLFAVVFLIIKGFVVPLRQPMQHARNKERLYRRGIYFAYDTVVKYFLKNILISKQGSSLFLKMA